MCLVDNFQTPTFVHLESNFGIKFFVWVNVFPFQRSFLARGVVGCACTYGSPSFSRAPPQAHHYRQQCGCIETHLHILISDIQVTEWWSFFLTSLVASATVQVYEYITTFDREVRILLLCELDLCWPVFSVPLFGQWNVVIPRSYT